MKSRDGKSKRRKEKKEDQKDKVDWILYRALTRSRNPNARSRVFQTLYIYSLNPKNFAILTLSNPKP